MLKLKSDDGLTIIDETDRTVDRIRENAKTMEQLIIGGKQPDHKTLLKHVPSDDSISGNESTRSQLDEQGSKSSEMGSLNAEITEMEKIRSVGNSIARIK